MPYSSPGFKLSEVSLTTSPVIACRRFRPSLRKLKAIPNMRYGLLKERIQSAQVLRLTATIVSLDRCRFSGAKEGPLGSCEPCASEGCALSRE